MIAAFPLSLWGSTFKKLSEEEWLLINSISEELPPREPQPGLRKSQVRLA
jgi:hypothetical protein